MAYEVADRIAGVRHGRVGGHDVLLFAGRIRLVGPAAEGMAVVRRELRGQGGLIGAGAVPGAPGRVVGVPFRCLGERGGSERPYEGTQVLIGREGHG